MTREERSAVASIPLALLAGSLVGWAGSAGGRVLFGLPVFALLYALAFLIQWIAFAPSFLLRSERFFDMTGSVTYIVVASAAVACCPPLDARSGLLLGLVVVWALRLGTFLLQRVRRAGKDERFDSIKRSFPKLLLTWTLQGLWVSLTLAAALTAITSHVQRPLGLASFVGLFIWFCGFGLEALADEQKRRFRSNPANAGEFIRSGLWKWSRHPNYFGEILLWTGVAVIAAPVLRGWQWIGLISPVFVILLLTRVSGIPILEKRADKKWGGRDDYEAYKRATSVLVLRPPRRSGTRRS
jgi:steroid 5-alpha reductase family enzyme